MEGVAVTKVEVMVYMARVEEGYGRGWVWWGTILVAVYLLTMNVLNLVMVLMDCFCVGADVV